MSQSKESSFNKHSATSLEGQPFKEALTWIYRLTEELPSGISTDRIEQVIQDVDNLFNGRFPGYLACDTRYHSFEHTLLLFPLLLPTDSSSFHEVSRSFTGRGT